MDIAIVQCDVAAIDGDSSSVLPAGANDGKQWHSVESEYPNGAMGWFHGVGSGQRTEKKKPACEYIREHT